MGAMGFVHLLRLVGAVTFRGRPVLVVGVVHGDVQLRVKVIRGCESEDEDKTIKKKKCFRWEGKGVLWIGKSVLVLCIT